MEHPIRILVVENDGGKQPLASELLADYDLEFSWQSVASEQDLIRAAQRFRPNIMICADAPPTSTPRPTLNWMKLFSDAAPEILVCQAGGAPVIVPQPHCSHDLPRGHGEPRVTCRDAPSPELVPLIIGTDADFVVLDSAGLITLVSANVCRILCDSDPDLSMDLPPAVEPGEQPTPAFLSDFMGTLLACHYGMPSTLMFRELALEGSPSPGAAINQINSRLRCREPHCGLIASIHPGQFLVVLPNFCLHARAASTAWSAMTPRFTRAARERAPIDGGNIFAELIKAADPGIQICTPGTPSAEARKVRVDEPALGMSDCAEPKRARVDRLLDGVTRRH